MKTNLINSLLVALMGLCVLAGCEKKETVIFDPNGLESQFLVLLENANYMYDNMIQANKQDFFPRSVNEGGGISYVASPDWCSGFFPGCLWQMAKLTGNEKWKNEAFKYTLLMEREKWNNRTHDMGFKIMCSFGNALEYTGNADLKPVIIQAANTLITRFNEKVGCIKSWDHNPTSWSFPVIIDNMMNLELLFKATELTGDSIYYQIAVTHANTTLQNHFRIDNSSYHVVDFNPETGEVIAKFTHQGDNDESAWSRGQAWGLYGYVLMYRATKEKMYLEQAQKIFNYIFDHPNLPQDKIPMWDFNYDEFSGEPRDVSAAAIIASSLFELAGYVPVKQKEYRELAVNILKVLMANYSSAQGDNYGYLLSNSVGFRHRSHEVDVPLIYADYYFLEALNRYMLINNRK